MLDHEINEKKAPIDVILSPLKEFIKVEASAGIVLLVCTMVALFWANSPWHHSYEHLWHLDFTVGISEFVLSKSIHHWINDGLMVVFFLLVGLEIKREVLVGELASIKKSILPIAAAIGGMVVPALIFYSLNTSVPNSKGWGIPMATDIAFAVAVIIVLGKFVPPTLKIFLLALAIVDDLGAVLVIAIFYTSTIVWSSLIAGLFIFLGLVLGNRLEIRSPLFYGVGGLLLWLAFLTSGVHATIAGVLLAMTVPTRTRFKREEFLEKSKYCLDKFSESSRKKDCPISNSEQQSAIHGMELICENADAPSVRMEHQLHHWVSFIILPVFALANAGVHFSGDGSASITHPVSIGVMLGLMLGKPIGITLFSCLAIRFGLADRPNGVTFVHFIGVGMLAGIGFTMSIFIANLAYADGTLITVSKIGILSASAMSAVLGAAILIFAKLVHVRTPKTETKLETERTFA